MRNNNSWMKLIRIAANFLPPRSDRQLLDAVEFCIGITLIKYVKNCQCTRNGQELKQFDVFKLKVPIEKI